MLLDKRSLESDSEEASGPAKAKELFTYTQTRARRRAFLISSLFLTCLSIAALFNFLFWTRYSYSSNTPVSLHANSSSRPFHPLDSLNGPPTARFRDNLKPNLQYITSWPSAGWTNDVMTYTNLIYLGFTTSRIPVIPMFIPSHIAIGVGGVPPIYFSDVFDLPRMRLLTGKAILEWKEVKSDSATSRHEGDAVVEDLGCWSSWVATQLSEDRPRDSPVPGLLDLDISYTKGPPYLRLLPAAVHDPHTTFWRLARLAFEGGRREAMRLNPHFSSLLGHGDGDSDAEGGQSQSNSKLASALGLPLGTSQWDVGGGSFKSPKHGLVLPPDEQMLCFDFLYFVCVEQPGEYDHESSPVWHHVAQHMHWTPEIENLARVYVNRALGVEEGGKTPPYISIHVRHADFSGPCGSVPLTECFAPLPVIARRVKEVQQGLLQDKGIRVEDGHVVVTSDERDGEWWREVYGRGWKGVDHEGGGKGTKGEGRGTKEVYGDWYPLLIDAAIQSGGTGFVGTDRSTMSIVAKRRVESWQDGIGVLVKWGWVGADDH